MINVAEPLGDRIIYDVKLSENETVKVKTAPTVRYEMGANITLKIDVDRTHLFDTQTELAIR
jgi:ABC-type sugar transport system ATPase subunit